jgi:hypothetical protein
LVASPGFYSRSQGRNRRIVNRHYNKYNDTLIGSRLFYCNEQWQVITESSNGTTDADSGVADFSADTDNKSDLANEILYTGPLLSDSGVRMNNIP